MITIYKWPWIFGGFFLAWFFGTNYTLNHFYVNGGYMLDSGWFAYLSTNQVNWPLRNPPTIGGYYFSTHFSPLFYIQALAFSFLETIGLHLTDATWFSINQGVWLALTAAATNCLLIENVKKSTIDNFYVTAASLFLAFNGAYLAAIGFPHFEIAIPSLLVSFFAFRVYGFPRISIILLGLGLLVREDAGLHFFGLFSVLSAYLFFNRDSPISKDVKYYAILAFICLSYSILAIAIQKKYFNSGDNALTRIYLGEPAYAHVTLSFINERIRYFFTERLYLVAPAIISLLISIYRRSFLLIIGVCAVIPWIIFSLLAVTSQAGSLTSYYSFPVSIAILWPAISSGLFQNKINNYNVNRCISTKEVIAIALSSLVLYAGSHGNHDRFPWLSFGPEWIGRINSSQTSLERFTKENGQLKIIYDDAVASLLSRTASKSQWRYNLGFSEDELKKVDVVLFQPGSSLTERVKDIARISGLRNLCLLENNRYAALSRAAKLNNCYPPRSIDGPDIYTTQDYFDYLQGWSNKEAMGRWTVGGEVTLPIMSLTAYNNICFKGHAFLPTPSSMILADVQSSGSSLGFIEYNSSTPDGDRCVPLNSFDNNSSRTATLQIRISGYSSPASQGLSSDDRPLGIFIERIYLQ